MLQASGSFGVHHDDLFILFRHLIPLAARVVVPSCAGVDAAKKWGLRKQIFVICRNMFPCDSSQRFICGSS
jgi:hypothetical protein